MPATAEPEGYLAEKAKGNMKQLGAGEEVTFCLEAGLATPQESKEIEKKIQSILTWQSQNQIELKTNRRGSREDQG